MELQQQMRRLSNRPTAWVGAMVILSAIAVLLWQSTTAIRPSHPSAISQSPSIAAIHLLDRNAERQPAPSPRQGGPGGQIGDTPSTP
jgi:hypothetical protein